MSPRWWGCIAMKQASANSKGAPRPACKRIRGIALHAGCGAPFGETDDEPDFGTDPKRLWLLRSRPDQVHRRTMRRGPSTCILAERAGRPFCDGCKSAGPGGPVCAPPRRPSPRGGGGGAWRQGFGAFALAGGVAGGSRMAHGARGDGLLLGWRGGWRQGLGAFAGWRSGWRAAWGAWRPPALGPVYRSSHIFARGKYSAARAARPSSAVTWRQ